MPSATRFTGLLPSHTALVLPANLTSLVTSLPYWSRSLYLTSAFIPLSLRVARGASIFSTTISLTAACVETGVLSFMSTPITLLLTLGAAFLLLFTEALTYTLVAVGPATKKPDEVIVAMSEDAGIVQASSANKS